MEMLLLSVMHGQCNTRPRVIFPANIGDRGTCVNNLPGVALDSAATGILTYDLLVTSPRP